MNITPSGCYLLVKPVQIPDPSGRVITSKDATHLMIGEVVSVGPGRVSFMGTREVMDWVPGDYVMYPQGADTPSVRNSQLAKLLDDNDPLQDAFYLMGVGNDVVCKPDRAAVDDLLNKAREEVAAEIQAKADAMEKKLEASGGKIESEGVPVIGGPGGLRLAN